MKLSVSPGQLWDPDIQHRQLQMLFEEDVLLRYSAQHMHLVHHGFYDNVLSLSLSARRLQNEFLMAINSPMACRAQAG